MSRQSLILKSFLTVFLLIFTLHLSAARKFASSSRLSSGKWVKIRVDSSAVYSIDFATLRQWGFPAPEKVRIYGYSALEHSPKLSTAPDDIPEIQSVVLDDRILFYGEGDFRLNVTKNSSSTGKYAVDKVSVRNYFDKHTYYFLSDADSGDRLCPEIQPLPELPESEASSSHLCLDYIQTEEMNHAFAGVYFTSLDITSSRAFYFPMPGYIAGEEAYFGYNLAARNFERTVTPKINASSNVKFASTAFGTISKATDYYYFNVTTDRCVPFTADGKPVDFIFPRPSSSGMEYYGTLFCYSLYPRTNSFAPGTQQTMYFPGAGTGLVSISDAPADLQVWDVTEPRAIRRCTVTESGDGGFISGFSRDPEADVRLAAFAPSRGLPSPSFEGTIDNCPDLHSMQPVNYVVITTRALEAQARRLAALHEEYQGFSTAVVVQNDIFNEFSSGSRSPHAVRRFLQMLYSRSPETLRYVALLGAPTYDPREISGKKGFDFLIGYETENLFMSQKETTAFSADAFFGILSHDLDSGSLGQNISDIADGADIGVGRLPVFSEQEAGVQIDRIEKYLSNPMLAGVYNRGIFIADQDNNNEHITNGAEPDANILIDKAPGATAYKCYVELYKYNDMEQPHLFRALSNCFAQSPRYICYSGHHGGGGLGTKLTIFKESQIKDFPLNSFPILFCASCETLTFNRQNRGVIYDFMASPDYGCMALIGSSKTAYMDDNHALNQAFTTNLYTASASDCIGDVYRRACSNVMKNSTSKRRSNTYTYNLAGDPGVPVYMPSLTASVTAIGSSEPAGKPSVTKLSPTIIEGVITDSDGNVDETFNGSLILSVFDTPYSKKTLAQHTNDKKDPPTVTLDETLLGSYDAEVTAGHWKATVTLPDNGTEGADNRVSIYALSSDKLTRIASGALTVSLAAFDPTETQPDVDGPEIDMYLNAPGIADGCEILSGFTLFASVADNESGIVLTSAKIENAPRLYLDGKELQNQCRLARNADATYSLIHKFDNLTDGRHTLRLRVSDNAGNHTSRELTFTVVSASEIPASLTVEPAAEAGSYTICLTHGFESEPTARLMIEDIHGNTVETIENPAFPYTWTPSASIPDGACKARVILRSHPRYASATSTPFTIVKP